MKPHGLLFKSEMIRALLNTKPDVWPAQAIDPSRAWKWQTRRTFKHPKPWTRFIEEGGCQQSDWTPVAVESNKKKWIWQCQFQASVDLPNCPHPVGTLVYAKETFGFDVAWDHLTPNEIYSLGRMIENRFNPGFIHGGSLVLSYKEDKPNPDYVKRWRPSIFMPPQAARLWFEVMAVRVERVNQISESDANAEGCPSRMSVQTLTPAVADYAALWDSINGAGDFAKGRWVWVYELQRITKPAKLD